MANESNAGVTVGSGWLQCGQSHFLYALLIFHWPGFRVSSLSGFLVFEIIYNMTI